MPIHPTFIEPEHILHSVFSGRVTDDELVSYYSPTPPVSPEGPWREIVDGRQITEMAITSEGQMRLASLLAPVVGRLRDGRVAMVAGSDVTFGMFRMWEMRRASLGYAVRVFRDLDAALAWVRGDGAAEPPP